MCQVYGALYVMVMRGDSKPVRNALVVEDDIHLADSYLSFDDCFANIDGIEGSVGHRDKDEKK